WDIANTHHTTVQKLKEINHLDDTVIYPGQILNTEENKSNNINHIVQKGDTLSELAEEFGSSIKDIKDQNNLSSDLIIIGDVLKINLSGKKKPDHPKQNEKNRTKNDSTEQASKKFNKSTKTSVEKQSKSPSGKTISMSATA